MARSSLRSACRALASVLFWVLAVAAPIAAQDQMRSWGMRTAVDTEAFGVPVQWVSSAVDRDLTMVVTQDGRLLTFGDNYRDVAIPPSPPQGASYTRVTASGIPTAVLSSGQLIQWTPFWVGATPPSGSPSLPMGMRWVDIASTNWRSFAVRSDGVILTWGTTGMGLDLVPSLSAGLTYHSVTAGGVFVAARVSDGTLRVWGLNVFGVASVPTLPAGVTFTRACAGLRHLVALRSDGTVVAWGDNSAGQCNIPTPPVGLYYTDVAAGGLHSLALRSDGLWVAWGSNNCGQTNLPSAPAGHVGMIGGLQQTIGLRVDGRIDAWGAFQTPPPLSTGTLYQDLDSAGAGALTRCTDGSLRSILAGPLPVPAAPGLPNGVSYTDCSAGYDFWLGLGSDGLLRAWGDNTHGQLAVPALPSGVTYTKVDAGEQTAVAIRSDGAAVAWGLNAFGQTAIPALPVGLSYADASAGPDNILLLRSDGSVVITAAAGSPIANVPSLPPGLRYTGVACGRAIAAALRSDGSLVSWGSVATNVPPLPPGLSYVEVACGILHAVARRSDGTVVTWGDPTYATTVPPPGIGRSYLRIAANFESSAGLLGAASRYVPIANGCAGSMPVSRLVPHDTPQIGRTFSATLTNLPTSAALMIFGWSELVPAVPLTALGMPGCTASISLDGAVLLSGNTGEARFDLAIPFHPALRGVGFCNQALVFDPLAGNAFAAVVSEAMAGTIGG